MCVLGVGLSFSYVESKKKKKAAKILDECWTLLFKK